MPSSPGKVGVSIRRIRSDNDTRLKIKTTQIQKRLTDHILGKLEMSSTQVTAALGLLKKTLPDLQAIEQNTTTREAPNVINANQMDKDEFDAKHSVDTPRGTTTSVN